MKLVPIAKALIALSAAKTVYAQEILQPEAIHALAQSPHDSLNNKDNVLAIQDDFNVYENFQYITHEKTVFVTLNPTTVYVTITEIVKPSETPIESTANISSDTLPKETEITSAVVSPSPTEVIVGSTSFSTIDKSAPTPVISSVVVVETETAIETQLTTKIVYESQKYTNATSEVLTTSTPVTSSSLSSINFSPTTGDLDMVLGDRKQFMKDRTNTPSSAVSFPSELLDTESSPVAFSTIALSVTEGTKISNTISTTEASTSSAWFYNPYSDNVKPTSDSSISSIINKGNFSAPQTVAQNLTGFEQLLENFSPYHDLPTADYEVTNGGNRLTLTSKTGAMAAIVLMLVGVLV